MTYFTLHIYRIVYTQNLRTMRAFQIMEPGAGRRIARWGIGVRNFFMGAVKAKYRSTRRLIEGEVSMKDRGWLRLHKWPITAAFLLALSELSTAGAQEGDIAEALRLTGQVVQYYATGRYQEAIPLAQRALAITEKARGPEHPDTARSLNNLAMLYQAISAYAQAAPLYEHALAIMRRRSAPSIPTPPSRLTISPRCTLRPLPTRRPSRSTGARWRP